jgi:hypothetical protein
MEVYGLITQQIYLQKLTGGKGGMKWLLGAKYLGVTPHTPTLAAIATGRTA